jgi:hypothetical protein
MPISKASSSAVAPGAKGELVVGSATNDSAILSVGSTNQTILADSTQTTGIKWAASPQSLMTATGDTLYASAANTPARLAVGSTGQVLTVSGGVPTWATPAGGATFSGCSLRSTVDVIVANATTVVVNFNTEDFDVDGYHDTGSNTNRITIPSGKTGYFLLTWTLRYQANATGYRNVNLLKNNSAFKQMSFGANEGGDATTVTSTQIVYAVPGDYFHLTAFQNSGSSLELGGSSFQNQNFGITYLGA